MTAKIENGKLIVTIDLQEPRPSASGKTLVVATTGGNQVTTAQVNGSPVVIGLNAYIKR
jgi:hypothetical protein